MMNLKTKMFLSVFIPSSVIILIFSIILFIQKYNSTEDLIDKSNMISTHLSMRLINLAYKDDNTIDEQELEDLKQELYQIKINSEGYVYVFDISGNVIIHPHHEGQNEIDRWYVQEMISSGYGSIQYKKGFEPDANRQKRVYYNTIDELGWIVASGPFLDEVRMAAYIPIIITVVALLLLMLLSFIVSFNISKVIYKPIGEGAKALETYAANNVESEELKQEINVYVTQITGESQTVENTIKSIKEATQFSKRKHTS